MKNQTHHSINEATGEYKAYTTQGRSRVVKTFAQARRQGRATTALGLVGLRLSSEQGLASGLELVVIASSKMDLQMW